MTTALRAALAAGAVLVALALVPGAATAATTFDVDCFGKVKLGENAAEGEVAYDFACTQAFTGYVIVSLDQDVEGFETETLAFNYMTNESAPGEEYNCQAGIPGNAVSCNGKASGGNRVRGALNVTDPCATPRPRFAVLVADPKGSPSPLFRLFGGFGNTKFKPISGCPKPAPLKIRPRATKQTARTTVRLR